MKWFVLWEQIKQQLRKETFTTIPELKRGIAAAIQNLNTVQWKNVQAALHAWPRRLQRVVENDGGYIEG